VSVHHDVADVGPTMSSEYLYLCDFWKWDSAGGISEPDTHAVCGQLETGFACEQIVARTPDTSPHQPNQHAERSDCKGKQGASGDGEKGDEDQEHHGVRGERLHGKWWTGEARFGEPAL